MKQVPCLRAGQDRHRWCQGRQLAVGRVLVAYRNFALRGPTGDAAVSGRPVVGTAGTAARCGDGGGLRQGGSSTVASPFHRWSRRAAGSSDGCWLTRLDGVALVGERRMRTAGPGKADASGLLDPRPR